MNYCKKHKYTIPGDMFSCKFCQAGFPAVKQSKTPSSEFRIQLVLSAPPGARKTTFMNLLLDWIEKHEQLGFTDLNEEKHSFIVLYKEK